eukprot:NODE_1504_length_1478_cov_37.011103_g1426_i0.p1 GENE.NODE_1504_length_1478_cov_37.011103_g1426_i0~~NODE_1504_length_1478_cov_37.011103_g1426_i0.p1  ORF type:complete len:451 (-),score=93.27 NODE_1504_length_1478_cov_37.011103_g1426_i0:4-1356(-)
MRNSRFSIEGPLLSDACKSFIDKSSEAQRSKVSLSRMFLEIHKKLEQQNYRHCVIRIFLSSWAGMAMIFINTLIYNFDGGRWTPYHEYIIWTQCLTFILTLYTAYFIVHLYRIVWQQKRYYFTREGMSLRWWRSSIPTQLTAELLVHFSIPYPGLKIGSWLYRYLQCTTLFRLYTVIRLVTVYSETYGREFELMVANGTRIRWKTTIKLLFYRHTIRMLGGATLLCMFFCSFAVYLAEYRHQVDFRSMQKTIWWSWVTFTTVGYGDMYPASGMGQMVFFVLSSSSIILVTLFSSVVTNKMALTKEEAAISQFLNFVHVEERRQDKAAQLIQCWFRERRFHRNDTINILSPTFRRKQPHRILPFLFPKAPLDRTAKSAELKYRFYHARKLFRNVQHAFDKFQERPTECAHCSQLSDEVMALQGEVRAGQRRMAKMDKKLDLLLLRLGERPP